jgi:hypothetical protein
MIKHFIDGLRNLKVLLSQDWTFRRWFEEPQSPSLPRLTISSMIWGTFKSYLAKIKHFIDGLSNLKVLITQDWPFRRWFEEPLSPSLTRLSISSMVWGTLKSYLAKIEHFVDDFKVIMDSMDELRTKACRKRKLNVRPANSGKLFNHFAFLLSLTSLYLHK